MKLRILITLLFLIDVTAGFAQSKTATQIYDEVVNITSENFYDQTFRGLDWPQLAAAYRQRVSDQSTLGELRVVLNNLLWNLKASHTEFITTDDQEYHGLQSIFSGKIDGDQFFQCGGWYKQVGKKWFIQNIFAHTPMAQSGLLVGDEIVSVNGKPFAEIQSCNTKLPVVFKYRRGINSPELSVSITPFLESVQELLLHATTTSEMVWSIGRKKVGYFHLWSGTHEQFLQSMKAAVNRMSGTTDVIILDLRDGFGGAWTPYIQQFFNFDLDTGAPVQQVYSKPVYVLINDGTRSGKEYLAYIFKEKRRAILIGTNTAGHFLGGRLFNLTGSPSALYLAVAGDPTGVLEGRGVSPDILVNMPLTYRRGIDTQLEKALELIRESEL
ncbi:MAG: S41 family peptidase [Pseudobdellovibrionaceae bacterium]